MARQPSPPPFRVTKKEEENVPSQLLVFSSSRRGKRRVLKGWRLGFPRWHSGVGVGKAIREMRSTPSETFKVSAP